MKRGNVIGGLLLSCAVLALLFGWPWGTLSGVILAAAGIAALRGKRSDKAPSMEDAQRLLADLQARNARGEPLPDSLVRDGKRAIDLGMEDWFQEYEALVTTDRNKVIDFSQVAREIRAAAGWPLEGSVLAYENASEEVDFVLTRTEAFGGKVPLREAICMRAMLDDGPERHYLKERQKRGYPSLFENEPDLEWSDKAGFFETQLRTRYNNVYFQPEKQCVSQHDLFIARMLDADDREKFVERCQEYVNRPCEGGPEKVPVPELEKELAAIYGLLQDAASIGEQNSELAVILRRFYDRLLGALYRALTDNAEATKALQAAEHFRWSDNALFVNPAINQTIRVGATAESNVVPTLLSQGADTIRVLLQVLPDGVLDQVQNGVRQIIANNRGAREKLRTESEKLSAIGLDLSVLQ